jgi:hypothetical protein
LRGSLPRARPARRGIIGSPKPRSSPSFGRKTFN